MDKNQDTYPGGKGAYQFIINRIQKHRKLIVPFLGKCAVSRKIKRSQDVFIEGYDLDAEIIKYWRNKNLLINTHFEKRCGIQVLKKYSSMNEVIHTAIYLDPPYLFSTRKKQTPIYKYEMSDDDHREILKQVLRIDSETECTQILISCYDSEMYSEALKGWKKEHFTVMTRSGPATETLYYNFAPTLLHDYQYLGETNTERQTINRKVNRWKKNLEAMPLHERMKMLTMIREEFLSGV